MKKIIYLIVLSVFAGISAFADIEISQTVGNFVWGNTAWEPYKKEVSFFPSYTSVNAVYVFDGNKKVEPFVGGSLDFGMMEFFGTGLNVIGGIKINFISDEKKDFFWILQDQIGGGYDFGFMLQDGYVMNRAYAGIGYMNKQKVSFVCDAKFQTKFAYLFYSKLPMYELGLAFSAGIRI